MEHGKVEDAKFISFESLKGYVDYLAQENREDIDTTRFFEDLRIYHLDKLINDWSRLINQVIGYALDTLEPPEFTLTTAGWNIFLEIRNPTVFDRLSQGLIQHSARANESTHEVSFNIRVEDTSMVFTLKSQYDANTPL